MMMTGGDNTADNDGPSPTKTQYTIILLLAVIIVGYAYFAYPYVFTPANIIQLKMKLADIPPLYIRENTDEKQMETLMTAWWNSVVTPFSNNVTALIQGYNDIQTFISNVRADFLSTYKLY
jgi:hypothetical protein